MSTEHDDSIRDDIFSKAVRAGKRTYFFDVKSTRGNDLYLTITESKKQFKNGEPSYEKHKLFLYKEDFEKFRDGLTEAIDKIKDIRSGNNEFIDPADEEHSEYHPEVKQEEIKEESPVESFTDISFDDLDKR
ncbi:DUF3276 family protein [Cryomorphaceae bacterium 1068]|nr:DUF3276 family protein [Cryomorphaceae bacterium 1068]